MPVILKGFMIITNSGAVMYAKKAQFSENIVLHTSVPIMCNGGCQMAFTQKNSTQL